MFDYVTDPARLSSWQNAESVAQLTPGPVGAGSRFREIHRGPFGRRIEELTEVVVHERGRRFEIRVVEGPPVDGRWEFAPSGDGTRVTFTTLARLSGRLAPLNPLVAALTRLAMRRYHARLRRALESEAPADASDAAESRGDRAG